MKRNRNLFNLNDQHSKRLKLAKMQGKELKVFGTLGSTSKPLSMKKGHESSGNKKGGVVVKGQTIVVKTDYEVAGKRKKDGSRPTRKDVGSHASASLDYMNNHGAEDIKDNELSNIYDEKMDRISKEDFKDLKQSMESGEDFQAMRRIIIDPGQKDFLTREDMKELVVDSMNEFMRRTDKEFDFKFAIHTDKVELDGNIHAHVLVTGTARDININKEQLQVLKETIADKQKEIIQEKKLEHDRSIDKIVDKAIEQEKDKSLTFNQQIDKELDGKLDDKFREQELEKIVKEVYEQSHTNNMELNR